MKQKTWKEIAMKHLKSILSVLLTAALVIGMGLTVFAAGEPTSITITNVETKQTFRAYQIFTGIVKEDEDGVKKLFNIGWGDGISKGGITALYNHYGLTDQADQSAGKLAEILAELDVETLEHHDAATASDARAVDFADTIGSNYNYSYGKSSTYDAGTKTATISGLAPGYYLVIDSTPSSSLAGNSYSRRMVQLVGKPVTIKNKVIKPTVDKNIVETTKDAESGEEKKEKKKRVYAGIEEIIDYEITSFVPNTEGYSEYQLIFKDTIHPGLSLDDGVFNLKVKIGEKELDASDYELNRETYTYNANPRQTKYEHSNVNNGTLLTLTINIKEKEGEQKYPINDPITITYSARLSNKAGIGNYGSINTNYVYLEYSNNPNDSGSLGYSGEVQCDVYTSAFQIVKTAGLSTGYAYLNGAEFRLYTDEACTEENEVKLYRNGSGYPSVSGNYNVSGDFYYPWNENVQGKEGIKPESIRAGTPIIKGLKQGTYYLKEVEAPAGYNLVDVRKITVDEYSYYATAIQNRYTYERWTGEVTGRIYQNTEIPFWDDYCNGAVDKGVRARTASTGWYSSGGIHVINETGTLLPKTGGIGTTIFYVIGAVLVIGAGVILVSRKRFDAAA